MKVLISGGGTGGHIYPAVAIAKELLNRRPDAEVLFVGALGKMEMEKVPKEGFKIIGLPIAGFNRSRLLANVSFPYKLLKSMYLARKIVKDFDPDIAVGVGGFASGPTLKAANMLGVKTLIQEQNSYAGVTNKLLSKKAETVCVAYPDMDKFFPPDKILFTGNPVRNDLLLSGISRADALKHFNLSPKEPALLVIGGSLGALSVNKGISAGLERLLSKGIQLVWQTGKNYIDEARQQTENLKGVYVADFIYEMDKAYAAADLVISRAGALSVSELSLLGKAAVLVPFPYAAEDHQTKNALSLVSEGAAKIVKDSEISDKLISSVLGLYENEGEIRKMEKSIKTFAKPDAAKDIVNQIIKITKK